MDQSGVLRAMAAARRAGYNLLVLLPACLPALGCSCEAPETPEEFKTKVFDPEKKTIDEVLEIPGIDEDFGDGDLDGSGGTDDEKSTDGKTPKTSP